MATAPIQGFRGEHFFLSNFYESVLFDDWRSAEHFFQAMKTLDPAERARVRSAPSPGEAKAQGARVTLRRDWARIRLLVMEFALREKFCPGGPLAARLLDTGYAHLEETNDWGDDYWGVSGGAGANHLGELLMRVRADLRRG